MLFQKLILTLGLCIFVQTSANDRLPLERKIADARFYRNVGRVVAVGSAGLLAYTMYACGEAGPCDMVRLPFMFSLAGGIAESKVRSDDIKELEQRLNNPA